MLFSAIAARFGFVNQYGLHAVYFATTIAVGVASAEMVEIPILKLRERLFPLSAESPQMEFQEPSVAVLRPS